MEAREFGGRDERGFMLGLLVHIPDALPVPVNLCVTCRHGGGMGEARHTRDAVFNWLGCCQVSGVNSEGGEKMGISLALLTVRWWRAEAPPVGRSLCLLQDWVPLLRRLSGPLLPCWGGESGTRSPLVQQGKTLDPCYHVKWSFQRTRPSIPSGSRETQS